MEQSALQLRTAGGVVIPGALTVDKEYHRFFQPAAPLAPGAYTMTLEHGCAGTDGTSFNVTAPQALPVRAGELRVARAARQSGSTFTSSGTCTEPIDAGVVDLAFELDAKVAPYASVLAWSMRADGTQWYQTTGAIETLEATDISMEGILRLFTACDVGSNGRSDGLKPGIHDIELTPTLVGSTTVITPAKLRVKVTCGADNGEVLAQPPPVVQPPTGQPPVKGVQPPPSGNAGIGTGGGAPVEESSDGGCAASSRMPVGGVGSAVAGLLLTILFAARRDRRRHA